MNAPKDEEAIFAEALRLPPNERAAYLAEATQGNDELRQRVESLLGSYEAGDFLEEAAAPQSRPTLQATVPLTERTGDTIGRYKLLQQIGEGGCGVVYMAEQAEPVRRRVALKIIKLGMDTKSVIARFEAERQALALMDHPNIAKVLDAGATETGRPYFVMELVRGMKITDYCDEKKLSPNARLDLFIQVCHAIQHAHQKGIIHRDIKPSNILVTVNDGVAVPKVIDFGVAKATGGQLLTDKTLFTAFEQFIGTPAYMSPEQAVLTSVDIDTRSDIYALGVLLYELLTGRTPFNPKELLAVGLDEMRRTIQKKEPARPSMRVSTLAGQELSTTAHRRSLEPPKLVSELRGDLDWIVMKCLEKDRARRYDTANGLVIDIQRHLNHEPVVACPPSKLYRFQKTVRRNKVGFAATAAVILALACGVVFTTWQAVRATRAERTQAELRQEAEQARESEVKQRQAAEHAQAREAEQRQRAETSAETARVEKEAAEVNLRMAQINQIQHHLDKAEVGPALALLEEQRMAVNMQDSRSLEWRHLWWRAHQGHRLTLRGHQRPVLAVAFVPDGSQVVSAGEDGTVRLWSTADGVEQATVLRGSDWWTTIGVVAVSPDGKTLAGADRKDGLALWDLPGSRLRHTLRTTRVLSLSFSPDSRLVAGGSGDGSVRLWNTATAEQVGPTLGSGGREKKPSLVAFSPDGRTLVCANLDRGMVTIHDLNDLNVRTQLGSHHNYIRALAISADGTTLISSDYETVKLWDVAASREKAEFTPAVSMPTRLALSPDGTWVAVGSRSGTIEVRELASGKARYYGHAGGISCLAFSPDGSTLASGGENDGTIKLWDFHQEQDLSSLEGNLRSVASVAYSPDGRLLAVGGYTGPSAVGGLELRDVASGRLLHTIPTSGARFAAFSPDGNVLACGPSQLWDVEGQRALPSLPHEGLAAAFSPDGRTLAIGGADADGQKGIVWLWNWRTGEKLAELQGLSQLVRSVAISPDGRTLASASAPGLPTEVILWDVSSGQRKHTLPHGRWCVAYSPDGKLLASGTQNDGIALWDPDTGRLLKDMVGHVRFWRKLAFAPDGKTIVSGNVQGGVSLWDVEKGIERATLSKRNHTVNAIAISPNGKTFATGDGEGKLEIWRTASDAEVRAQSDCFDPRLRLTRKYLDDARTLQEGSRPKDALRAYTTAERLYKELAVEFPDQPDYQASLSLTQNDFAWLLATSSDSNQRDGQRAIDLAEQAVAATGRTNAMILDTLAAAHAEAGQFAEAVRVQKEAIALLENPEAKADYESRLRLFESSLPYRPYWAEANRLHELGRLAEAESLYRQALAQHRQLWQPGHTNIASVLATLATLLLDRSKFADAEPLARECLAIREEQLPDNWLTFNARSLLGASLLGQKKYADAEPLLISGFEGMEKRRTQIPPAGQVRPREALERLGMLYSKWNKPDQAAEWKRKLAEFESK